MTDYERINSALSFVPSDDRDTWVKVGMAIKSELGDSGFDIWDLWSQQAKSYNPNDARDVWRSIKPDGGVTIGTLFHEATASGWRDDSTYQRPSPEELAERQRIAEKQAACEQAVIQQEQQETASKAAAILKTATPAQGDHPYLVRKQVAPVNAK